MLTAIVSIASGRRLQCNYIHRSSVCTVPKNCIFPDFWTVGHSPHVRTIRPSVCGMCVTWSKRCEPCPATPTGSRISNIRHVRVFSSRLVSTAPSLPGKSTSTAIAALTSIRSSTPTVSWGCGWSQTSQRWSSLPWTATWSLYTT